MMHSADGMTPSSSRPPMSFQTLKPSSAAPYSTCRTSPPCQPQQPTTGCPQPLPGSQSRSPTRDRVRPAMWPAFAEPADQLWLRLEFVQPAESRVGDLFPAVLVADEVRSAREGLDLDHAS